MESMVNMKVSNRARYEDFETAKIENLIPETTKIRNHLERYGHITQAEATRLYGITRLAAVIYKLRYKIKPYMDIGMVMRYGQNRFGKQVQYGEYFIKNLEESNA